MAGQADAGRQHGQQVRLHAAVRGAAIPLRAVSRPSLQILGSPSADFADQEYEEAAEIGAFCQKNYGVEFPLTERTSVRADPSPLWQDLARQPKSGPPVWNFTKYLVGADGRLIARWATKVKPEDPQIVAAIEAALPGSSR